MLLSLGLLVALVTLAGSIRITHASGNPFEPIWEAIHVLQAQVAGLPTGMPTMYNKLVPTIVPPRSENPGTTPAYAFCDSGDTAISGGYAVNFFGFDIISNGPYGPDGWQVGIANQNDVQKTVTVIIRCADTNL